MREESKVECMDFILRGSFYFVPICVLHCILRSQIGWLYNLLLYTLRKDTGPEMKWLLNVSF